MDEENGEELSDEDEYQYSPYEDQDDDPDLSLVLALILQRGPLGQVRLAPRHADDSDDDTPEIEEGNNILEEPDTMAGSDLMQDILLFSGKLKKFGPHRSEMLIPALRNREINCCGATRKSAFTPGCRRAICSQQLPMKVVKSIKLGERLFCGIYSEDGNTFLSACQDGLLRVYDTRHFRDYTKICQPFKTIPAIDVGWSILDVAFSPDAYYLAYSTWSSDLHLSSIYDNGDPTRSSHTTMDLQPEHQSFAAFSLQFSGDNNEILCGANDGHLYIYDRHLDTRTSRIDAHDDDVNAIRFADKESQILFSGGDDGLINVWDRRMLCEDNPRPVGVFAGHVDGITYIDSKEDSRYLLSNSKDQTVKVWDMRKFSSREARMAVRNVVSCQTWDYRWQQVPRRQRNRKKTVKGDTSVKTYQGHVVTNTLIRARFSPMHSTGQKYIYCGCSKGNVVIYDVLSGEIVSKQSEHRHCVRDVSWHPFEPMLVSSSWDSSFNVWSHEMDEDVENPPNKSARKRRHKTRVCCDSDAEDEGHVPNRRRSPRLARSKNV